MLYKFMWRRKIKDGANKLPVVLLISFYTKGYFILSCSTLNTTENMTVLHLNLKKSFCLWKPIFMFGADFHTKSTDWVYIERVTGLFRFFPQLDINESRQSKITSEPTISVFRACRDLKMLIKLNHYCPCNYTNHI